MLRLILQDETKMELTGLRRTTWTPSSETKEAGTGASCQVVERGPCQQLLLCHPRAYQEHFREHLSSFRVPTHVLPTS